MNNHKASDTSSPIVPTPAARNFPARRTPQCTGGAFSQEFNDDIGSFFFCLRGLLLWLVILTAAWLALSYVEGRPHRDCFISGSEAC